jgi:hypothetical protein
MQRNSLFSLTLPHPSFLYKLGVIVRRTAVFSLCLGLCLTTIACGSPDVATNPKETAIAAPSSPAQTSAQTTAQPSAPIPDGQYPVQQASYDDSDGRYSIMLLNTPAGVSSLYNVENLAMARLTDAEVQAGQESYLQVENGEPALHLTPEFRIEYTHNVAEVQNNPQTGAQETVIVRRESSFWTPFMGAIAGQMVANALFTPHYYVPPVYGGGPLVGYGGYGRTYDGAVSQYRQRYNEAPAVERNRQTFRTTGRLRRDGTATTNRKPIGSKTQSASRGKASGSGFGTSTLRRDKVGRSTATSPTMRRPSNSSFGTGRPARRSAPRSFSRGRRR